MGAAPEVGGGNQHLAQLRIQGELAHDLANLEKMRREAHTTRKTSSLPLQLSCTHARTHMQGKQVHAFITNLAIAS